jgi:hypothetical protein
MSDETRVDGYKEGIQPRFKLSNIARVNAIIITVVLTPHDRRRGGQSGARNREFDSRSVK